MSKLKFGTEEVIATVVATFLYVLLEWAQRAIAGDIFVPGAIYEFFKFRVLVVCVVAAIYGPVVGIIVAIGSAMIVNVMFYGYISPSEVVAYVINAFVIGYYSENFEVLKGNFKGKRIIDYNAIQFVINLFCSLIYTPLLFFIFEGRNLYEVVKLGMRSAIGNILGVAVFGTIILILVSRISEKRGLGRLTN